MLGEAGLKIVEPTADGAGKDTDLRPLKHALRQIHQNVNLCKMKIISFHNNKIKRNISKAFSMKTISNIFEFARAVTRTKSFELTNILSNHLFINFFLVSAGFNLRILLLTTLFITSNSYH